MKRILAIVLMIFGLYPLGAVSQQKGYEIYGHFDGLQDGKKVYMDLYYGYGPHDFTTTDSAYIKKGDFHIKGYVPDGPRFYWLRFENQEGTVVLMINNNEVIKIHGGNIDGIPGNIQEIIPIEGSPTMNAWLSLINVERFYYQNTVMINNYLKEIKDSIGFDHSLVGGLIIAKNKLDDNLFSVITGYQTPSIKSLIPLFLSDLGSLGGNHQTFLTKFYNFLDSRERNSYYGKKLKERVSLCVNQPFPKFTLPTAEGKMIALNDILAKGKVTLIHLWASNSFERENYQEELRILYKKYQAKGLNVIGISADSVAEKWKTKLDREQYPWINVSDLKGNLKGGIIQDVYHEGGHSVPNTTNILLDAEGKIIAWDVSGVELQWYLWKYLGD